MDEPKLSAQCTFDVLLYASYITCIISITYQSYLLIAAILYIVALQFCSGKTIPTTNTYKLPSILPAQHADLAQTSVGITFLRFMKCVKKTWNVLYINTTDTFAPGQNNPGFAFHCLGKKHAHKKYDPGLHQTMKYRI